MRFRPLVFLLLLVPVASAQDPNATSNSTATTPVVPITPVVNVYERGPTPAELMIGAGGIVITIVAVWTSLWLAGRQNRMLIHSRLVEQVYLPLDRELAGYISPWLVFTTTEFHGWKNTHDVAPHYIEKIPRKLRGELDAFRARVRRNGVEHDYRDVTQAAESELQKAFSKLVANREIALEPMDLNPFRAEFSYRTDETNTSMEAFQVWMESLDNQEPLAATQAFADLRKGRHWTIRDLNLRMSGGRMVTWPNILKILAAAFVAYSANPTCNSARAEARAIVKEAARLRELVQKEYHGDFIPH